MEQLIPANYQTCFINQKDDDVRSEMYKCEGIFADFLRRFKPGYGQMKSVLTETDRFAKPSVMLSAPDIEHNDEQTMEITRLALLHCLGEDPSKRRRYALINYEKYSFIIGGYEFDMKNKRRLRPIHDFVYDISKKTCRPIPSFPSPGRISFGVAPSERYIVILGGQTYDNVSLSSAFIFDTQNIEEVACSENRVIVVGGYDIVAGDTDMLSSHYQMDLDEKVWRKYADLSSSRARPLIICTYRGNELELYVAGGYTVINGKMIIVDEISSYNAKRNKWKKLTNISKLQMTHAIPVANTKLIISEEATNSDNPDQPEIHPIRTYDFETNEWTEIIREEDKSSAKITKS